MNAGAPAVALRAVRVSPVLVDDMELPRSLGRPNRGTADGGSPDPETVRWARAWMVAWQAVLYDRGVIGAAAPWTVAIAPAEWPALRGDPDRVRQRAAATLLLQVGLAELQANGDLAMGERAFAPHRAGLELNWGAAFRECRGEPAALLTLRAVVDGLRALDDPAPITLRELAPRTGYGEKQVRTALHRLVTAGVLATREAPGQPTRYRVTDALLGRGAPAAGVPTGPQVVAHSASDAIAATLASRAAPAGVSKQSPAFRLSLNGATVTLAAGLTANIELDVDGVPHLHISAPESR